MALTAQEEAKLRQLLNRFDVEGSNSPQSWDAIPMEPTFQPNTTNGQYPSNLTGSLEFLVVLGGVAKRINLVTLYNLFRGSVISGASQPPLEANNYLIPNTGTVRGYVNAQDNALRTQLQNDYNGKFNSVNNNIDYRIRSFYGPNGGTQVAMPSITTGTVSPPSGINYEVRFGFRSWWDSTIVIFVPDGGQGVSNGSVEITKIKEGNYCVGFRLAHNYRGTWVCIGTKE